MLESFPAAGAVSSPAPLPCPPSVAMGLHHVLLGWAFPKVLELEVGFPGRPEGHPALLVCRDETTRPSVVRDRPDVPVTQAFHMWLVSGEHAGT